MNFASLLIFGALVGVAVSQGLVLPDVEARVPHELVDVEPDHGTCYYNTAVYCDAGFFFTDLKSCVRCECTDDHYYVCCGNYAEPKVRKPSHCKLSRDEATCEFILDPKCPKACDILGYYYSDVSDRIDF
ncbi:hypothetical protein BSL78_07192 [Apostichopus japonicus]|uniref:Uncharacterized protein n=1 Tax=Stichopus japonicus TaxID=307972 RepID=A0A2G8L6N7_STIJA|nr:hypothetical protein BSL78_07192 [Apostichopus japonicus]